MITVYGIKNCDTVRKVRKWLEARGTDHRFHDFRVDGLERAVLKHWVATVGWEALLNRRGTTWRQLTDPRKEQLEEETAVSLMLEHPTLIKRPVLETGNEVLVGFDLDTYSSKLPG